MSKECKEELVSIIIPVYNTPKQFLKECLESIRKQCYKNIEVIIVDDGSVHETASYLDTLKEKNIVIAHKNREGVSSARNYGVRCATGNYICFVDADDLISEKFVEALYKGIKENQTLMSACQLKKVKSLSQITEPEEQITFENFCGADIWQNVNAGYCTTKMYDKSVFLNSEFDETISMCEDALFVSTVLNKIQRCCETKSILYYYRENPQGASHLANAQKYKQAIDVSKKIMLFDLIRQTEANLRIYKEFQAVWELKYMLALSDEDKSKDNDQIRSEQELYRKELLPYTKKRRTSE